MTPSSGGSIAAVILAAGAGTRLRPLTTILPKALCPVGHLPLVDYALDHARRVTSDVAVNVHHGREAMVERLDGRAHLSIEMPEPLGTAGALGKLREWIAGRDLLVVNADGWHRDLDIGAFVMSWDRERIRLMTVEDLEHGDFGSLRHCGVALMPWSDVSSLEATPSGLFDASWGPADAVGRLELVVDEHGFFDCGTLREYHAANMAASGGKNVVGKGAQVEGTIERTVLWPGVRVEEGEHLVDAIRPRDDITLQPLLGETT